MKNMRTLTLLLLAGCSTTPSDDDLDPTSEFRARGGGGGGSIDQSAQIKTIVRQNQGQIQACYEQRRRESPSLDGRVEVGLRIEAGRVATVNITENTTRDSALGDCIVQRVQRWRFDDGITSEISLPFALSGA